MKGGDVVVSSSGGAEDSRSTLRVHRPAAIERMLLFTASLGPVAMVVAVRAWDAWGHVATALLLAAFAGSIGFTMRFTRSMRRREDGPRITAAEVHDPEPLDGGFVEYALAFLLPAALIPLQATELAGLAAFVLFFAILWDHGKLVYQSPMLALAGWHVWSARVCAPIPPPGGTAPADPPRRAILLCRRAILEHGDVLNLLAHDGLVRVEEYPG